MKPTTLAD
jgi:hypothetical protein